MKAVGSSEKTSSVRKILQFFPLFWPFVLLDPGLAEFEFVSTDPIEFTEQIDTEYRSTTLTGINRYFFALRHPSVYFLTLRMKAVRYLPC